MSRRSWFVKEDNKVEVDANVLSAVNVPGSSRTDSPVVVVDAATLGNVNPGDGPTITLTADQLLRVNVPTGEPPKSGSKPATPTLSRSTSRVYQVNAADLANVNQTQA